MTHSSSHSVKILAPLRFHSRAHFQATQLTVWIHAYKMSPMSMEETNCFALTIGDE